ncbi:5'-nucleotidase [Taibaiella lutea]|uniref:5'-nucleotidase n=1 Tax=Taibaiella lutea TaxID=2608001 RepID=UPI001C105F11|nr:5'-nucleotidase [Taibaiella lutea]
MPIDFTNTLVVGISSRALFDLEEENKIFEEQGVVAFREFQKQHETTILKKGTGFHIVKALLNLNKFAIDDKRLVEVIVMSKNSPETGLRVLNSIIQYELDITRSAFTGGEPLYDYIDAFSVDLFLSKDEEDVQKVIDSNSASAAFNL